MNSADSESLARRLLAAGYTEDSLDRSDVAILNTCVVRQASEDRVYAKLHELKEWKTPLRTIAVTGCIVAKEGDELKRRFPHLDAVVPIGDYEPFVGDLEARYDYSNGEAMPQAGRTGVSHFVRVIQGCDHNCTFCIVPRVRGREKHAPLAAVVEECRVAVADGAREVVLLGQNVDDYHDPDGAGGLATLVRVVQAIPGLKRLRFMTSHPQDLEPELLNVGGGLGIAYLDIDEPPSIDQYIEVKVEGVQRVFDPAPRILVEPGRSLVGNAGITAYRVGTVKEIPGVRTYVAVDGGMSDNLRPMLYGSRYEAVIANRAAEAPESLATIAGMHCESGDVLIRDTELAAPRVGDVLVTPATGAYGYAMANNYNGAPRPPVIFCRDGDARVVIRRETWDDLLSRDE